jgi:hypothetical protein
MLWFTPCHRKIFLVTGIGCFASKCPYDNNKGRNEEEYHKKKKKNQKGDQRKNKNKFFKKKLFSKEDGSSSDEDDDSENDSERVLFIEIQDYEDSKEKGEFDLSEELINALEELGKERKKIKSLKEELKKKEGSQNSNSEETKHIIRNLKI